MPWVKLDDRFPEHRKVVGLSDKAFRLHVEALCYCARNLTDGAVPKAWVGSRKRPAEELVTIGVWDRDEQDYVIHDYLDYNLSRSADEERKAKKAAAGQAGGQASARARATRSGSPTDEPKTNPRTRTRTRTPSSVPSEPAAQAAMFGAVVEVMGYPEEAAKTDATEIGGVAKALLGKGITPEELAVYVEWLTTSPDTPLVGGRRLTLHSLPKWVKDYRARPRMVVARSDEDSLEARIARATGGAA